MTTYTFLRKSPFLRLRGQAKLFFAALPALLICLWLVAAPAARAQQPQTAPASNQPGEPPAHAGEAGAKTDAPGHEAAGHEAGNKESTEHIEEAMKMSPVVRMIAGWLGISPKAAYWLFTIINFSIIAGALAFGLKKGLPGFFPARTAAIQKGVEEARKASAESSARLADIEARLGRLDSEIASMRSTAEAEGRAEDGRLRQVTEDERRKILASAEQEITAAAGTARRDLKQYAAGLAVALAEKKIKIDEDTDRALVREFTRNLDGENG